MFDMLNQWIQQVAENGQSKTMFLIIQSLNIPFGLAHALWCGYKMKLNLKKIAILFFVAFASIYSWMLILHWAYGGFDSFGGQNMVMVYVWVPLIALILCRLFGLSWTEECYIHATSLPLSHGIGHFACLFEGCCAGYESYWGVYHHRSGTITFPIQLIESMVSFVIVTILMIRSHKTNYVADEKQFPLMLVMYGAARFLLEFFRNNDKILLGCSDLALHASFMMVVGAVWLINIDRRAKKAAEPILPTLKGRRK